MNAKENHVQLFHATVKGKNKHTENFGKKEFDDGRIRTCAGEPIRIAA